MEKQREMLLKFEEWCRRETPDYVTRQVLTSLVDKYIAGDPKPLFGKMSQLEEVECYDLCRTFKSMFDFVGINDEYIQFKEK